MGTRQDIVDASNAGTLLETLSATPYAQFESTAGLIADLHNRAEIDFLASLEPQSLGAVPDRQIHSLHQIFCRALPCLDCSTEAAESACSNIFSRLAHDGAAAMVYASLTEWFRQAPSRTEEGLALICRNPDAHRRLVRPVLLAGATHDDRRYVEEAFNLSSDPHSPVRSDALWTLGRIVPSDNECLLVRTIDRFHEIIDAPETEQDTAMVVEAALDLLHRADGGIVIAVEPLLEKASRNKGPSTRQALATGLLHHRRHYSDAMIEATFAALRHTSKHDPLTSQTIDAILYQWDLDTDRRRLLNFVAHLFTQGDDALDLETLRDFNHQLRAQPGDVLGWYVVSLLLSGDHALCTAAAHLLPYRQARNGFDIDLDSFSLTAPWIPYLARKILGYCLSNKESAAALLLSCLRATPEHDRADLENLVFGHFLVNHSTAIDWLESSVSDRDRAKQSVDRLSSRLREYVTKLERHGTCAAFKPSERERQLQAYRQTDFWRDVQKKAEQGSLLSVLAHKATILYGTSSIIYVRTDPASEVHRQEVAMGAHEQFVEFPTLEVVDPVGLHYHLHRFRSEPPPS